MSNATGKRAKGSYGGRVVVCLLEQHPFVALYLQKTLRETKTVRFEVLFQPTLRAEESKLRDHDLVLVIDRARLVDQEAGQVHSLRAIFPRAKILILGDQPATDDEVCRLLYWGIHGFIKWDDVQRDFIQAACSLSKGELWISPEILCQFTEYMERMSLSEIESHRFTKREWAVIGLLQRRLADKEISSALHVSERTVRYHLTQIFDKLGVRDRHAVVDVVNTASASGPIFAAANTNSV